MKDLKTGALIIKLCNKEMKKLPILCNFFMRLYPIFFLVKNRTAGEISCGSHCVNKIGQIMKFISYSNGKTSFKSREHRY